MASFDSNAIEPQAYRKLDSFVDSFEATKSIPSDLLYGDPKLTPEPWISVVIPTYKRDDLLKQAIESVLGQLPVDFSWELLIVDNTPLEQSGQTPALKIITELNNERILYYHNTVNIGSGYNWNRAAELARGEWICMLHDDDVMCSDALRKIYRIIKRNRNRRKPLGYIHADRFEFSGEPGGTRKSTLELPFCIGLTRLGTLIIGGTVTGMPSCGTTILKKAYCETGGVNYGFGPTADAVLGYRIMKKYTVLRSGCILGGYRWEDNETLKKSTLQKLVQSDYLFGKYRYHESPFSSWWGKLFGNLLNYRNIKVKISTARHNNIKLTPDDFAGIVPFNEPSILCKVMYTLIKYTYRIIQVGHAVVCHVGLACYNMLFNGVENRRDY